MTPEVFLRLTLLHINKARIHAHLADSPDGSCSLARQNYTSTNELRDAFMAFWIEELARRIALNASLRSVLLFLLPSQWGGEACDSYYLREDTDEKVDLQYLKGHCSTEQFLAPKSAAETPFFLLLDQFVALLRPKLPQQLTPLTEWMTALDNNLLAMRIVFVTLHNAFLSAFCEVDKQLTESHHSFIWEGARQKYCTTVCDLCHLLDAQLLSIVTRTMAVLIESACGSLKTSLFEYSGSRNPDALSDDVAELTSRRLGSIGAYVATTTTFDKTYPNESPRVRLSSKSVEAGVDCVRRSFRKYAEKLKARAADETARDENELTDHTSSRSTAEVTIVRTSFNEFSTETASVSLEQAGSLIAPPDGGNLASRVAAIAPADDDTLKMVEQLLSDQRSEEARELNVRSHAAAAPNSSVEHGNSSRSSQTNEQVSAEPIAAATTRVSLPKSPVSLPKHKSNHRETWIFWSRLQRKLGLQDTVIQRISEQCKLEDESPYPGVFLVDLDARNNDRATVAFVETLRELLPNETSAAMPAENVRLFKEACAGYAEQLLAKSKELQSTLPFLPSRTDGVLLGSLNAVLRADKQFQSLKEIYQQTSHLATGAQRKAVDDALLANVQTLIMRRIHFFSKPPTVDDDLSHPLGGATPQTLESNRRRSLNSLDKTAVHHATATNFDGTQQPNGTLLQYAKRRSSSSVLAKQLQSYDERARRRSSVMEALSEARRSVAQNEMPMPPPETRIEEVYRLACRFYGVTVNSGLVRQLKQAKENYITTLDLSSNYVGVKGLKPVLALLHFNGNHLISLSLSNNNIENEEVEEICQTLAEEVGENLVHLDLSFNPVSASASASLHKLCHQLPHLESLTLKATLLPPDAVQGLQQIVAAKASQRCY